MNSKKSRREKFLLDAGLDPKDLKSWMAKHSCLKARNCNNPLSKCYLLFEDYVNLALEAGLTSPKQIGRSQGQYQMGRIGDTGDYVIGNCRFITVEQNIKERFENGGDAVRDSKLASRNKNNHESVARVSDLISKDFLAISPLGKHHEGRNLKEFCKEFNIPYGNMSMVCRGLLKHTKGWTGQYL